MYIIRYSRNFFKLGKLEQNTNGDFVKWSNIQSLISKNEDLQMRLYNLKIESTDLYQQIQQLQKTVGIYNIIILFSSILNITTISFFMYIIYKNFV